MNDHVVTLNEKLLADDRGFVKIERKAGDPFVLYDAVIVLVPRKQYASKRAYQNEWRQAMKSLVGSCPGLFNPRDPEYRCPECNGVGYLYDSDRVRPKKARTRKRATLPTSNQNRPSLPETP